MGIHALTNPSQARSFSIVKFSQENEHKTMNVSEYGMFATIVHYVLQGNKEGGWWWLYFSRYCFCGNPEKVSIL